MNAELMYSSKNEAWATPQWLFDQLNAVYHFDLDPCSTHDNHKCNKYFTINDDGLTQDWTNHIVFMNPPYCRQTKKWVEKATHFQVVALLPSRTDVSWFHDFIYNKHEVEFLRGRLKFGDSVNSAPFPSMLVYFNLKRLDWRMK